MSETADMGRPSREEAARAAAAVQDHLSGPFVIAWQIGTGKNARRVEITGEGRSDRQPEAAS